MSTDPNTNAPPKAPVLCAMDCGFFGSEVTGNCCSKCYLESLKAKNDSVTAASVPSTASSSSSSVCDDNDEDSMDIDSVVPLAAPASPVPSVMMTSTSVTNSPTSQASKSAAVVKKKKTKKASYKSMMSTMMKPGSPKDLRKEREALSKGLGGGAFSKIDKI